MKKFLPVILALAMLVVPVRAVSYVADGGLGYKLLETMKRTGATKVQAVVTLDKEGTYMSRFALFGKRNQFLTAKPCPKEAYMGIEKIIDQNHVLQEVRDLNCSYF